MRRLAGSLIIVAIAGVLSGSAAGTDSASWTLPAGNLAGTRAAGRLGAVCGHVSSLRVSWRFAPAGTRTLRLVRFDAR